MIGLNKEPAPCMLVLFADMESAIVNDCYASQHFKLLNGQWKFNWIPRPADRPVGFHQVAYDVSGWGDTTVPRNWQLQG